MLARRSGRRGLGTRSQCAALFSTSPPRHLYKDTLKNLRIGPDTRVIFQGFTGRQATANAQESLAWGTKIVGGVTPGREGTHPILSELPVLPTVRAAMELLKPDATGIYVAAHQAAAAIEEAIEAEVPLIVAVAEHIPVHDMLKVKSKFGLRLRTDRIPADTFHAEIAVKIASSWSECARYHLRHWALSHRVSAAPRVLARTCWNRRQERNPQL